MVLYWTKHQIMAKKLLNILFEQIPTTVKGQQLLQHFFTWSKENQDKYLDSILEDQWMHHVQINQIRHWVKDCVPIRRGQRPYPPHKSRVQKHIHRSDKCFNNIHYHWTDPHYSDDISYEIYKYWDKVGKNIPDGWFLTPEILREQGDPNNPSATLKIFAEKFKEEKDLRNLCFLKNSIITKELHSLVDTIVNNLDRLYLETRNIPKSQAITRFCQHSLCSPEKYRWLLEKLKDMMGVIYGKFIEFSKFSHLTSPEEKSKIVKEFSSKNSSNMNLLKELLFNIILEWFYVFWDENYRREVKDTNYPLRFTIDLSRRCPDIYTFCRIMKEEKDWYKNIIIYMGLFHTDGIKQMLLNYPPWSTNKTFIIYKSFKNDPEDCREDDDDLYN